MKTILRVTLTIAIALAFLGYSDEALCAKRVERKAEILSVGTAFVLPKPPGREGKAVEEDAGKVGPVTILRKEGSAPISATAKMKLNPGDLIVTPKDYHTDIGFYRQGLVKTNDIIVRIAKNSELTISEMGSDVVLVMEAGHATFWINKESEDLDKFEIHTPGAIVGSEEGIGVVGYNKKTKTGISWVEPGKGYAINIGAKEPLSPDMGIGSAPPDTGTYPMPEDTGGFGRDFPGEATGYPWGGEFSPGFFESMYDFAGEYGVDQESMDSVYLLEEKTLTMPQQIYNVVPYAPDNLILSVVSPTRIRLTWDDFSYNERGFKIERSEEGSGFVTIGYTAADKTNFSDTGLTPGTKYYYRVAAINDIGSSGYTSIENVETLTEEEAATAAETAATTTTTDAVLIAPTGLTATALSSSVIRLSWKNSSENNAGTLILERKRSGGTYQVMERNIPDARTAYNSTGLAPNTIYFYRVGFTDGESVEYSKPAGARTDVAVTDAGELLH